jgi:hypothetical protein
VVWWSASMSLRNVYVCGSWATRGVSEVWVDHSSATHRGATFDVRPHPCKVPNLPTGRTRGRRRRRIRICSVVWRKPLRDLTLSYVRVRARPRRRPPATDTKGAAFG